MTTAKVALSIPTDVLKQAKKQVSSGRAKSLSFYVSEALGEKLRRDELADVLDAMDRDLGKPRRADTAWAKRVLKPSS
jgi:Arc/MetJ-type ribon-helix-helix transcriptional regulator